MGISLSAALGSHPTALALRAERTQIIASNLANQSTPGYQARDMDFRSRLRDAQQGAGTELAFDSDRLRYRVPGQASRDGNTVELGKEQAEFAQNAVDFQTSLAFLNMKLRGLNAAISGGA